MGERAVTAGAWSGRAVDVEALAERLGLGPEGPAEVQALCDTPDGALAGRKAALLAGPGGVVWSTRDRERRARRGVVEGGRLRGARAWWSEVAAMVGDRPLVEVVRLREARRAGGAEGVEVVLRVVRAVGLPAAPDPLGVEVRLRGGGAVARRNVRRILVHLGLAPGRLWVTDLARSAGRFGRGKALPLDPAAPAADAVRRLLASCFAELRSWEPGVRRGEVEALHHLRVALRTARALLASMGDLLGTGVRGLRRRMRTLQALTGPLRDLDVHLEVASDAALIAWLRERQAEERAAVRTLLGGARYGRWIGRWEAVVADTSVGAGGGDPIAGVARLRVWRAWAAMRDAARGVDAAAPAELLHEVRKDGKRLRYLVELLLAVLDESLARELLQRLKPLQSVLGAMQDLAVQRATLEAAGSSGAEALAACVAREADAHRDAVRAVSELLDPGLDRMVRALVGLPAAGAGPR